MTFDRILNKTHRFQFFVHKTIECFRHVVNLRSIILFSALRCLLLSTLSMKLVTNHSDWSITTSFDHLGCLLVKDYRAVAFDWLVGDFLRFSLVSELFVRPGIKTMFHDSTTTRKSFTFNKRSDLIPLRKHFLKRQAEHLRRDSMLTSH